MTGMFLAFQLSGAGDPSFWPSLVLPAVIVAIFYFLAFAPMRKRQKTLQLMIENLKKGDRVLTTGGLYGEVAGIDAGTVVLKIADNVKVKLAKSAIAGLEKEGDLQ
jgi:preprotein translocase subunit YajC